MAAQLLFDRLLRAESEPKVDTILNAAGYSLDNEAVWQPLGGMENNFSTVGNQQTEATAAFVEKIQIGFRKVVGVDVHTSPFAARGTLSPVV